MDQSSSVFRSSLILSYTWSSTLDTIANSGVFLRGRYEVQIETESASEPPSHHTGGVYGFLDPIPEQPRKADQWQSFDITLVGRTVTVVQNGVTVIDHKEIPGITGGALDSQRGIAWSHLPPGHRSRTRRFPQHRNYACAKVVNLRNFSRWTKRISSFLHLPGSKQNARLPPSARVHCYGTFDANLDVRPAAVGRTPSAGCTSARSAGMGAAGIPYTCPGPTTGRFSSAEHEFRYTDRHISRPIGYWQRGGAGQRQL